MDEITLGLILFRYIPETALVVTLSLILTGYEAKLKTVTLITVIGAPLIAVIRSFSLTPGVNTIIMLPVLILLITFFCRIGILSSSVASGLGLIIMGLTETVYTFCVTKLTGIEIKIILADPILRLLVAVPEYIFLAIIIIICKRYHLVLINIRELNEIRQQERYAV